MMSRIEPMMSEAEYAQAEREHLRQFRGLEVRDRGRTADGMAKCLETLERMREEMKVEYREIIGYRGYRVGNDGTVWSCKNRGKHGALTDTWRLLKPRIGSHGYYYVNLCNDGLCKSFCIHAIVLTAFCGPCPNGNEGCHGAGGPLDNSISNLRWGTPSENAADKKLHGTEVVGERHPAAKLSNSAVRDIRSRYSAGVPQQVLADGYGVNQSVISEIVTRKAWSHVA